YQKALIPGSGLFFSRHPQTTPTHGPRSHALQTKSQSKRPIGLRFWHLESTLKLWILASKISLRS
ncbi:MAG: hypothetical protein P8X79_11830, partial [Reinekea sp.]